MSYDISVILIMLHNAHRFVLRFVRQIFEFVGSDSKDQALAIIISFPSERMISEELVVLSLFEDLHRFRQLSEGCCSRESINVHNNYILVNSFWLD